MPTPPLGFPGVGAGGHRGLPWSARSISHGAPRDRGGSTSASKYRSRKRSTSRCWPSRRRARTLTMIAGPAGCHGEAQGRARGSRSCNSPRSSRRLERRSVSRHIRIVSTNLSHPFTPYPRPIHTITHRVLALFTPHSRRIPIVFTTRPHPIHTSRRVRLRRCVRKAREEQQTAARLRAKHAFAPPTGISIGGSTGDGGAAAGDARRCTGRGGPSYSANRTLGHGRVARLSRCPRNNTMARCRLSSTTATAAQPA